MFSCFSDFAKLYDELKQTHSLDGFALPGKTLLHTFSDATKESRRVEFVKFLRLVTALEPLPKCVKKFLRIPNFKDIPDAATPSSGPNTLSDNSTDSISLSNDKNIPGNGEDRSCEGVVPSSPSRGKRGSKWSVVLIIALYALVYFRVVNIDVSEISPGNVYYHECFACK